MVILWTVPATPSPSGLSAGQTHWNPPEALTHWASAWQLPPVRHSSISTHPRKLFGSVDWKSGAINPEAAPFKALYLFLSAPSPEYPEAQPHEYDPSRLVQTPPKAASTQWLLPVSHSFSSRHSNWDDRPPVLDWDATFQKFFKILEFKPQNFS